MRGVWRWRRWLGLIISVIAVLAALVHLIWPGARIDGTTALLLGIALVPWLGELLESIELPGGLKVKYREIQRRQDAVEASAREASSAAQAALGATGAAMRDVDELVARYHDLRSQSFPGRTTELDRLFGMLLRVVAAIPDFDVLSALRSPDGGMRLAGYAYVYEHPDPTLLNPTIDALLVEHVQAIRFNQYWALNAIDRITSRGDVLPVSAETVGRLRSFAASLDESSNRRRRITELLNRLGR
jgi:hypothetical protein